MTGKQKFLSTLVHFYRLGVSQRPLGLVSFCRANRADISDIASFAARLKAEGSLIEGWDYTYQLTDGGYRKYRNEIEALDCSEDESKGASLGNFNQAPQARSVDDTVF